MSRLQAYHIEGVIEAGCDEAGRGCLAGPVVAAAVILPEGWDPGLNDSKQLTESRRASLRGEIESGAAIWAVGMVDHKEIDEINILNASFLAMHRALEQLKTRPEHILVDGNRFHSWQNVPHTCMVKGDSRFLSIAAASILAKTHRDQYMQELHERYPAYGWDRNKGYPTSHHREAIREFGPSPFHRMSFTLLPEQLSLF